MSATEQRILDAALAGIADHGLARLTLEDVATRADVSRQTVYRYFGSRDALVSAVVLREEQALIDTITAAAAAHDGPRDAFHAAVLAAVQAMRAHPLLDRLVASEPEAVVPFLTTRTAPVLPAARPVLERLLAERLPDMPPGTIARAADATIRLLTSYAVNPPEEEAGELADSLTALLFDGLATRC